MVDGKWKRTEVHEALVALYLRLNGYFTTGLVVHAPEWGRNRTEIDCLAVRHPNHMEPERGVGPSPFLSLRDGRVDLLICEVKSDPTKVAYNERLRTEPDVLESVLQWAGILRTQEIPCVAEQLRPILREGLDATQAQNGILAEDVRVRGLLCCPSATEAELPRGWCLRGSEILRYASECFNPPEHRDTCSTRYSFSLWGSWLTPLVKYFKNLEPGATPSLDGLHDRLGTA